MIATTLLLLVLPVNCERVMIEDLYPPTWEEKYRPSFHFTIPGGWMGAPTGIVFDGEKYHLFAKYSPYAVSPDASYWYHAASTDLVHWTHLGNVLSPRGADDIRYSFNDRVGEVMDGSAVLDTSGSAGCGVNAIVLYWTDREPTETTPTGFIEQQRFGCLYAEEEYSTVVDFSVYAELNYSAPTLRRPYDIYLLRNNAATNPAYYTDKEGTVTAGFESDLRAPKVFNSGNTWHLALANCDRFVVYTGNSLSGDFVYRSSWGSRQERAIEDVVRFHTPICDHTYEGTWGRMGDSWEMPDLVPILSETNSIWWVVFVSVASPSDPVRARAMGPNGGSGTQYFLGQFDGGRFLPIGDQDVGNTRWIDYGFDFYAARTISHPNFGIEDVLKDDAIMIGSMNNEIYSESLPTFPWKGAMTLPRRLKVKYLGSSDPHVSQEFLGLEALRSTISHQEKTPGDETPARIVLEGDQSFESMEVNVTWREVDYTRKGLELVGTFAGANEQTLRFGLRASSNGTLYFFVERMPGKFDANFDAMNTAIAPRLSVKDPNVSFQVVLDRSSIELLADHGLTSMTLLHFPENPWRECHFNGDNVQWSWTLLNRKIDSESVTADSYRPPMRKSAMLAFSVCVTLMLL